MVINDMLNEFEKKIGYKFKNQSLLKQALTHKSYAFEKYKDGMDSYNERIEFLGDAVLDLVIAEKLYKYKPCISEGDMSKKRAQIVCEKSLADVYISIDAENYLFLGKCELATDGRRKRALIADSFEAVLGAIYLDSNYEEAKTVALRLLDKKIKDAIEGKDFNFDYKTNLQELLQKRGKVNISYTVISESGPDHNKIFESAIYINDVECGRGTGKTRKTAEQNAARVAYEKRI